MPRRCLGVLDLLHGIMPPAVFKIIAVSPGAALEQIIAAAALQGVGAAATVKGVITGHSCQPVITVVADDGVGLAAAVKGVVIGCALNGVGAAVYLGRPGGEMSADLSGGLGGKNHPGDIGGNLPQDAGGGLLADLDGLGGYLCWVEQLVSKRLGRSGRVCIIQGCCEDKALCRNLRIKLDGDAGGRRCNLPLAEINGNLGRQAAFQRGGAQGGQTVVNDLQLLGGTVPASQQAGAGIAPVKGGIVVQDHCQLLTAVRLGDINGTDFPDPVGWVIDFDGKG